MPHPATLSPWTLLLGLCCSPGEPVPDDTEADEVDCLVDVALFGSPTVEATAMPTVLRVSWETTEPTTVRAVFRETTEDPWRVTPPQPRDLTGSTLLLGLPEEVELEWYLVADDFPEPHCSEIHGARTGTLSPAPPAMSSVLGVIEGELPGFVLVPVAPEGGPPWATIIDDRGRLVWSWRGDFQSSRMILASDHQSVLVSSILQDSPDFIVEGVIRLSLTGEILETWEVPNTWVDFTELPDGTLAVLTKEQRTMELGGEERSILGDALVLVSPDGGQRTLWSTFDATSPQAHHRHNEITLPSGLSGEDWSHATGLEWVESSGMFIVTSGGLSCAFAVDGGTGETLWTLGGDGQDWHVEGTSPLLEFPHSVQWLGDHRLLIFDNTMDYSDCSRAVEIQLDPASGTASVVASMTTDDCLHNYHLGSAYRTEEGGTLISWSSLGLLELRRPDNEPALTASLGLNYIFGFALWESSLY